MIDQFEEILASLGRVLHLPLHMDKNHACSIQFHHNLVIQLRPDPSLENLLIFCKIIEVPPGKFRENVLKEALKANASPDQRVGIFAYIAPINHLALFQKYPFRILTGERLAGVIGAFLDFSESWRSAITNGYPSPSVSSNPMPKDLPGPLGLKP